MPKKPLHKPTTNAESVSSAAQQAQSQGSATDLALPAQRGFYIPDSVLRQHQDIRLIANALLETDFGTTILTVEERRKHAGEEGDEASSIFGSSGGILDNVRVHALTLRQGYRIVYDGQANDDVTAYKLYNRCSACEVWACTSCSGFG
ncbi:hypothetical protein B0A55_13671 [Friedmanniomyces simplex]|uniref:Uncharacterized protein n=1 Tax=Friedmanniomyces simplex TaxID=329884 RepID=A0A4U0VVU0_9PEZI|nr:hypothetical protein B0A55_13671 [Friedmanniomyces simplex]